MDFTFQFNFQNYRIQSLVMNQFKACDKETIHQHQYQHQH